MVTCSEPVNVFSTDNLMLPKSPPCYLVNCLREGKRVELLHGAEFSFPSICQNCHRWSESEICHICLQEKAIEIEIDRGRERWSEWKGDMGRIQRYSCILFLNASPIRQQDKSRSAAPGTVAPRTPFPSPRNSNSMLGLRAPLYPPPPSPHKFLT